MLLVNFNLEKSFTYCTNVHSHLKKWNKYISTYKSQCFKEVYDFMLGHTLCSAGSQAACGLDSPGLNRMGLKKDMRNDNLFFKRVTNIIIPDYPLSIDM